MKIIFKRILFVILIMLPVNAALAGTPAGDAGYESESSDYDSEVESLFNVTGDEIVETAKKYIGTPYRYGSKGPKSFDCSGFTSYVYGSNNIKINSNSRSQFTEGLSVEKDDVKVGDLVFFGGSRSRGVGHVGIISSVNEDGSFKFIHASCSNGVTESDSNEPYYQRRYKGARRILADYSDIMAYSK